jgi:hypothetical protein
VTSQLHDGRNVDNLLGISMQGEVLGNLPDKDFAIFGSGGDDAVVERVPCMFRQPFARER